MDRIKIFFSSLFLLIGPLGENIYFHVNEDYQTCHDELTIISHYFDHKEDPLSAPELFELRNHEGKSLLFGRFIRKEVCITGECRMLQVWIFWDGVGQFLGLHHLNEYPLTKSDHLPFTLSDYEFLYTILDDTASMLKELLPEDLISSKTEQSSQNLDAITTATIPALSDIVVKDAAYTCYTLWHTVYGPVQDEIFRILRRKIDLRQLEQHLRSEDPNFINWALNELKFLPVYQHTLIPQVLQLLQSENLNIGYLAFNYLKPHLISDIYIQEKVTTLLPYMQEQIRYELLWYFVAQEQSNEELIYCMLKLFDEEKFDVGHIRLIYSLIDRKLILESDRIRGMLFQFLEHNNGYVQSLSLNLLKANDITIKK